MIGASPANRRNLVAQNSAATTIAAALIVGASIVAGALLIQSSVNQAGREVAGLRDSLRDVQAGARPEPAVARPSRPDPNRRYSVNTAGAPVRGNPNAKLSIVEFSDFQCPYCARVRPTLEQIEREYGDKIRVVFKNLPLSMHPKAPAAAAAAEAAHRQGKFWEMHDMIFADQRAMSPEKYLEYAKKLGLDVDRFKKDMDSAEVRQRIQADAAEAARLGVTGTPAFFINGRFVSGAQPYETFKSMIDQELGRG
jgi:protein-disulfide isomerase